MEENNASNINGEGGEKTVAVKEKKSTAATIYDMLEIFCVSIAVVMLLFTFIGRMTTVDGNSMYPTLEHGERLWITSIGYEPDYGDVVIVHEKDGELNYPLVKRVIALGGDTIEFDFQRWEVRVNGVLLEEDYIHYEDWKSMKSYGCEETVYVPEGYVFVMGDNRNSSTDSRDSRVGFVHGDDIVGKATFRFARFGKSGFVD